MPIRCAPVNFGAFCGNIIGEEYPAVKEALTIKVRAARPRVRRKKPKPEAVNVVERIREIAIAIGGFDDLELPERFKNRTRG
ncbi:MAG: hypothetical protein ACR2P4_02495 [Gammaproteobacteria bacterium]